MVNITGKVKWFSAEKGYGFIQGEDGEDYFVHYSEVQKEGFRTLFDDQEVNFEVGQSPDGQRTCAVDVHVVENVC